MRITKRLAAVSTALAVGAGTLGVLAAPASAHPQRPVPGVIVSHVASLNVPGVYYDAKNVELWGVYLIKDFGGGAIFNTVSSLNLAAATLVTGATTAGLVIKNVVTNANGGLDAVAQVVGIIP